MISLTTNSAAKVYLLHGYANKTVQNIKKCDYLDLVTLTIRYTIEPTTAKTAPNNVNHGVSLFTYASNLPPAYTRIKMVATI